MRKFTTAIAILLTSAIAFADITENKELVSEGNIGLFEDAYKEFGVRSNEIVSITSEKKPDSISFIRKKLQGKRLSYDEFYQIIDDISNNRLSQIETTYFVSACYTHELNTREIVDLTNAMINTGDKLNFGKELVFDKLDLMRLYLKEIQKKADMKEPMIIARNSTLKNLCEKLHKDFVSKFRFARIWGKSAKFDGQKI